MEWVRLIFISFSLKGAKGARKFRECLVEMNKLIANVINLPVMLWKTMCKKILYVGCDV